MKLTQEYCSENVQADRYYLLGASALLAGATFTQSRVHAAAPAVDYAAVEKV